MPISRFAFISSTIAAILIGFAALIAIVGATFWLVGKTQSISETVDEASRMRTALVLLQSDAQDAETGQRGYLLTSDVDYLKPYQAALERMPGQIEIVRAHLLKDDGEERGLLDQLSALLGAKLMELKRTVDLTGDGKHDEALALVKTDRGRILMDQAREVFGKLLMRAEIRVNESIAAQSRSISDLYWVTLAGSLIILAVVGLSAWAVVLYMGQLSAAERKVQTLNAGLEERVQERTADLDRANQEIQRFAYIVTHDLRAPLVNIMGFTSELESSLATLRSAIERQPAGATGHPADEDAIRTVTEDVPEAIGFIRSSTQKMDRLINAILKLSREGRRNLKPEPIDLENLLQVTAASVQHQVAESGGEIRIGGSAPRMVSDRIALEQIFGNLFDNAVKYRSKTRPLLINVEVTQKAAGRVVVEVQDNGRGIAAQDQERVFDLFRRSGPQDQPGEGIGLAHVRTMIRNLGGEISLRSTLDRGTTMILDLPRSFRKVQGVS